MFERGWVLCVLFVLGVFAVASCDTEGGDATPNNDASDLSIGVDQEVSAPTCLESIAALGDAVCPAGSNPELSQTQSGVCDTGGSLVARDGVAMGTCNTVASECVLYCQLTSPCFCGVQSQTQTEIVCEPCSTACGNALCEPGEDPDICATDCGPRCEPGNKRCYGKDVETCTTGGLWERTPCTETQVCADTQDIVRCISCDADDPPTWYIDRDGDLRGDPSGATFVGCSPPPRYSLDPSDCDDGQFDPPESNACGASCSADDPPRQGFTRCGLNMNGFFEQTCVGGVWTDTSTCLDVDVCVNGEERHDQSTSCGLNAAGKLIERCVDGAFVLTTDCDDPHNCKLGAPNRRGPDSCSADGHFEQECVFGTWTNTTNCLSAPVLPPGYAYIPAGTFIMGSPVSELGRFAVEQQHEVTITRSFIMKATEVTQGEWTAVGLSNPSGDCPLADPADDSLPVVCISWSDALAYCNALSQSQGLTPCYDLSGCTGSPGTGNDNSGGYVCPLDLTVDLDCDGYRLPTESEWEYAARAGTTTAFFNGDITTDKGLDANLIQIAWYDNDDDRNTGRLQTGGQLLANPWGLFDTQGNASEWVWDHFEVDYPNGPVSDPGVVRAGNDTIFRGGSYNNSPPFCRSAARQSVPVQSNILRLGNVGVRPVRTLQE